MTRASSGAMSNPSWWTSGDTNGWDRVREALQRDWDQTKHDLHVGGHELNQGLTDTVEQAAGRSPMPPIDKANPPKVVGRWEDAEMPIGYGYAARNHRRLASDWDTGRPWDEVRIYVRHGYEIKR
jgi:hypothetical protein